jgi:hypothetical protein
MGILHITRAENAPCPILATFFCRKGGITRSQASLNHAERS